MLIGKDAHSHETYNLRHRKNMQERCSFMCSVKRSSFERGLLRHFQHSTVHSALPGIPYRFRNRHMGNTCHPTRFRNGEQQPTRSRCRTESSLQTDWQVAGRPLSATGWRVFGNGTLQVNSLELPPGGNDVRERDTIEVLFLNSLSLGQDALEFTE